MKTIILSFILLIIAFAASSQNAIMTNNNKAMVTKIFDRVSTHNFNPLNDENSMTQDRNLKVAGIADLKDEDWKVRLLAVRDLVRAGANRIGEIKKGLEHESANVRQVSAMALGILSAKQAITELEKVVVNDDNAMVRSQAVIALGQIESESSLDLLKERHSNDPSRDVRHQCELAVDQIKKHKGTTKKQLSAYLALEESTFETVHVGSEAPNFKLEDTEGIEWQLNDFSDKKWVVLIWVFADWCPVCHGEFHDLMKMKQEFMDANVQVFTIEIHDLFRGRVMVGKELEPSYWFAKQSFKDAYTSQIWWPHLLDRAGAIGAKYGAEPLAFSVHAEYINRPTTVIIDPQGKVRLIYPGTFWGDRPTIEQTLEMIKTGDFDFKHPERLSVEN